VSKLTKYTPKTKRKNCGSDSLEVFKFPKFEPILRGVANIKNKNTYYYFPCFAYSERDETFEISLNEIYRTDTNKFSSESEVLRLNENLKTT